MKDNLYLKTTDITIYNDDILTIDCIKENSIDLIVTSPPYNVDIKYGSYNDKMDYKKYLDFTEEWLKKCYELAKYDGRFCLNIPLDKNKGGQQSVCADITTIAKSVGWKKTSGSGKSDINKKEFLEWTNGVWNFNGESKKRVGHPAPFPVELPKRCIKLFSFVGDTILDPFLGSGSTLLACVQTNRKGIGIDIDKSYCELSKQRLIKEGEIYQTKLQFPYYLGKIGGKQDVRQRGCKRIFR